MTTSLVDAETILAIDIGSVQTRALLFDEVDGRYHFLAQGMAPTTAGAPFYDVSEGFYLAVQQLQKITGRKLLGDDARLTMPADGSVSGVDRLAVSFSAGEEVRVAALGLLADVSLDSAQQVVRSLGGTVVDAIGLNDRRRGDERLDALLAAHPEIVMLVGGAERGATRSVLKHVELLQLALNVLPKERRPRVIYAGNSVIAKRVQEALTPLTSVRIAPNVRPGIDQEDLAPAREALAAEIADLRSRQNGGFDLLRQTVSAPMIPTSYAIGRMVSFLGNLYNPSKGVLAVDVGGSSTVFAASQGGQNFTQALRPLGLGAGLRGLLQRAEPGVLEEIIRWLPANLSTADLRDLLWQKSLFPSQIPMTPEALAVDQAAARVILRMAAVKAAQRWPELAMAFEPILLGGAVFSETANPAQALLMALDGLQPVGVTTIIQDSFGLTQALGAAAPFNTLLPVQVLDSGAYFNLGTVITPLSNARPGALVMRVTVEFERGSETSLEVKQGALVQIPLRPGQSARLQLHPQRGVVIDPRRKSGGNAFKVTGGACGVVIDARGRPVMLPKDPVKRRELLARWSQTLVIGGVV